MIPLRGVCSELIRGINQPSRVVDVVLSAIERVQFTAVGIGKEQLLQKRERTKRKKELGDDWGLEGEILLRMKEH